MLIKLNSGKSSDMHWLKNFLISTLLGTILFACGTKENDKYKRIVDKSWIQDSSHSMLTAYSFEFEDYIGKTMGEFLADYPDSAWLDQFVEDPIEVLRGWYFRYSGNDFEVMVIFNYDTNEDVNRRDSNSLMEWQLDNYLDEKIRKFEVYDFSNNNTIIPRKYDKLNIDHEGKGR